MASISTRPETGFRPMRGGGGKGTVKTQHHKRRPPTQKQIDGDVRELEKRFGPIFQDYAEQGGIPLHILRDQLQADDSLTKNMDAERVELLLRKADVNRDGRLSFDEFQRIMTRSGAERALTTRELTNFQKMIRGAVSTVLPRRAVDDDMESYVEAYSCCPPPLFMVIVSIVEIAVFVYYAVIQMGSDNPVTATTGVAVNSPLVYNPARRYEAWRYLTYMLMHQGYTHLIFNLIFQLLLGIPLELVHKWWRVGIVYSLGVIAGSLATSVTDPYIFLVGASGGCYAIIGAHLAIIVMNWEEMTHEWMSGIVKFILSAPVRLIILFIFAAADIGMAIYKRYYLAQASQVGYAAHFGGALCGLLIGIPVLRNLDVKAWEKVIWWIALITFCVGLLFCILWNGFATTFPPLDWRPCCPAPAPL